MNSSGTDFSLLIGFPPGLDLPERRPRDGHATDKLTIPDRGRCRCYPKSRWTEITSLSCSSRLITLASWATEATSSVAMTVAVRSGVTATVKATLEVASVAQLA